MRTNSLKSIGYLFVALLLIAVVFDTKADFVWEYGTPADGNYWIEGYRLYQDDTVIGTFAPDARSATEAETTVVPDAASVLTMTAFRGANESDRSPPGTFDLTPPTNFRTVTTTTTTTTTMTTSEGQKIVHSGQ